MVPQQTGIGFSAAAIGTTAPQTLVAEFAVSGYTSSFTPTAKMHYGHDYTVGAANCTSTGAGTRDVQLFHHLYADAARHAQRRDPGEQRHDHAGDSAGLRCGPGAAGGDTTGCADAGGGACYGLGLTTRLWTRMAPPTLTSSKYGHDL